MADGKFSLEDDNLLVNLIEQNRPLYDPQNESYKDMCIRDNILKAIATKLNKTDEACKKRWKYIRDSYNRYKRKRKCSTGSAVKAKNSKWDFFQRLRFLEKVPMERNTDSSINTNSDSDSMSPISASEQQLRSPSPEQQANDEQKSQSSVQIPPPPRSKPSRITKQRDEFLQIMKEREESRHKLLQELSQTKNEATDDEDTTTFANHVKSVLKKLSPRLKLQAKNEIFATLTKYETLNLDMQEGRPTTSTSSATISTFSPISAASTPEPVQPALLTLQPAPQTYYNQDLYYGDYSNVTLSKE